MSPDSVARRRCDRHASGHVPSAVKWASGRQFCTNCLRWLDHKIVRGPADDLLADDEPQLTMSTPSAVTAPPDWKEMQPSDTRRAPWPA